LPETQPRGDRTRQCRPRPRLFLAESIADSTNVPGPLSPEGAASAPTPAFSAARRDEGMKRISDLYSAWHGKENGRVSVFPTAALSETSSPELLKAVHAFAEKYDLRYSIHLSQSRAEVAFAKKHYGVSPVFYLDRAGFVGPRLFAAHLRYVDEADIALLGRTRTTISHQAAMAANRGVKRHGPYRLIRHPMYLGYAVTQIGFALLNPVWSNFLIYGAAFGLQIFRLKAEEGLLVQDPIYAAYMQRVRYRLAPGLF